MKTTLFSLVGACTVGLVATVAVVPPCRCGAGSPRPVMDFGPVTDFHRLDSFLPLAWSVLKKTDNKLHQYVDLKLDDDLVRVFVGKRGAIQNEEELVALVRKKLLDAGYRECEEDPSGFILGAYPAVSLAYLGVARRWEPVVVVVSYHADLPRAVQAMAQYVRDVGL